MNHIYRLVWNKKRNMLMAVGELASTHGKDASGETDANSRPGARPASLGARSLLAAAVLSVFPLVSFAQTQQHTIEYGNVEALSDTDGTNAPAAAWQLINNGRLDISATETGSRILGLSGSGEVVLGGKTLSLSAAHDTFYGALSGSGGLLLQGGTEYLTGSNTYTGATTIGTGTTLGLAGYGSIAASSGVANNGVLDVMQNYYGTQIQSLSGSGSVLLGGQTLTLTNASNTFAGSISGAGGLAVNGGAETLSNAQNYSGATTIATAGTLALAGSGSVALSSGVIADGVLDIAATSNGARIQSLSGSGSVLLGGQTLTLTNAGMTINQVEGDCLGLIDPGVHPAIRASARQVVTSTGADFSRRHRRFRRPDGRRRHRTAQRFQHLHRRNQRQAGRHPEAGGLRQHRRCRAAWPAMACSTSRQTMAVLRSSRCPVRAACCWAARP
jgi:hypothetical protein